MRDLIEWSGAGDVVKGRDAVRFFLISRKADTESVFDVDVLLANSDENPVYYVQYAHARICRMLAQYSESESDLAALQSVDLSPLTAPREALLLQKLAEYPEMLEKALEELDYIKSPFICVNSLAKCIATTMPSAYWSMMSQPNLHVWR